MKPQRSHSSRILKLRNRIKDHYELEKGRGKVDTIGEMWYEYVHVLPKLSRCELEFILAIQIWRLS
jgi:hypothetical protein